MVRRLPVFLLTFLLPVAAFPQAASNRYAIFLQDEPLAKHFGSRTELDSPAATTYRQRIETAQQAVRSELTNRGIRINGSVNTLLNAIFVVMPSDRVAEVKGIAGVLEVAPVRRHDLFLNRATTLMNAPQAWALTSGGQTNAGAGIKIGIIDTGVDQTHPALQDASLQMPAGYPKCSGTDCAFTSNKVIVARSYIRQLAAGTNPANPAADSRPDDYSARDHIGHGTATASTAAALISQTAANGVTISGMAPKAYIGSYKVFGSPTVNDGTYGDIEAQAIEDALKDGMDIVSFSGGGPAFTGPLDTGAACGLAAGVFCDVAAAAFEAAAQKGLTIVVAAGNNGANGWNYPLYNSISTPGNAPSVITAGATTSSHGFSGLVEVTGSGVPANLNAMVSITSDSFASGGALSAALIDVTTIGNDGYACTALPAQTLNGAIALIERGPTGSGACSFSTKMANAASAGAWGVVFYMATPGTPVAPTGLSSFTQTASMISNTDGVNLKNFLAAHPGYTVTIDPAATEVSGLTPNQLASFGSFGPSLGVNGLKPDLLAVGESIYMPTQNYDILGEMFSSNRFIFAAGTSFSTPLIAGAAALVKQNHPAYKGPQIKSALIDTATRNVTSDDQGSTTLTILQTGAGQLTADMAIKTTVTANPASISFGVLKSASLPVSQLITFTNTGASSVTLALSAQASTGSAPAALDKQSLTIAGGGTGTATLTLSGSIAAAGIYSGTISVTGGAIPISLPWMYLVGTGTATNIQVTSGDFNDGTVNQLIPDGQVALQLTDDYGVPVPATQVSWVADNGIKLTQTSTATDAYGMAYATVTMGPIAGTFSVYACVAATCSSSFVNSGGFGHAFTEYSRPAPVMSSAGVVNAASYKQPVAPGSYITMFGTGLYDSDLTSTGNPLDIATGPRLPLALDYTMVSFDVPSAGISVPCRMYYVSAGQISCQVPWELQGQTTAKVKVTVDFSYGNVVDVPLSTYSPAMFPYGSIAAATNNAGVVSTANPAVRGQNVTLYCNGLGPVTNQPASGEPASLQVLSQTTPNPATVTIGGVPGNVTFSGLAPSEIGVYQINVTVPAGVSPGTQPIIVSIGGVSSPASSLPIQ